MPTYEYACKTCGEHIEVVQSFRDDPLTECPACGGALRKVFGSVGITFKGSGFYKTDSRSTSKSSSPSDGKSGDSKSGDSKSSEKKSSDSKSSDTKGSDKKGSDKKSTDSSGSPKTSSEAKTA